MPILPKIEIITTLLISLFQVSTDNALQPKHLNHLSAILEVLLFILLEDHLFMSICLRTEITINTLACPFQEVMDNVLLLKCPGHFNATLEEGFSASLI